MRQLYCMFVIGLTLIVAGLALLAIDPAHLLGVLSRMTVGQRYAAGMIALGMVLGLAVQASLWFEAVGLVRSLKQRAADSVSHTRLRRLPPARGMFAPVADAINAMIDTAVDDAHRAELELKERDIQLKVAAAERDHAQAIIYSISDAVLVTDPFDELVLANESASRTFDFELARAGRAPIEQLLRDPRLIELIRDMRQCSSHTGRRIVEHQVRTPQGERFFKVTLSCVADAPNRDVDPTDALSHDTGVVAVLQDMTREKEVAEMKNDFVSNVSHELRTPLASIKAYVEMLIDGEAGDDKTRNEFYEVIQSESNRLSRLIDNILNISRIESGLVRINKLPLPLSAILKDGVEVIRPQADAKNITLVEKLPAMDYRTLVDRDMMYQAVLNLLSNAVKYTPEGGTVTVEATVDESARKILAHITDTGVGIPPKDLAFVFDKFYRVEANNHMAKGTGLGLAMVKHIVETVHKGRIFVQSGVGSGSQFGLELNLISD